MATQSQTTGPTPLQNTPSTNNPTIPQEKLLSALDNGIWYALSLWPALHVAVQNSWGGADTLDKKDWFAGAVSTLLADRPDTDQDDLEMFLLQIMEDEFDCRVEDETEVAVAGDIMRLREGLLVEGDMEAFKSMEGRWRNRGLMKVDVKVADQTDRDEDGIEEEDDDEDVEMGEAPALVPAQPKEKPEPEVDEDGFTKVVGKKKR